MKDIVIIGGSYAGLAAAMSMGRALRNVLIIDSGNPCNKQTPHSHNFLTQDGQTPAHIRETALSQVLAYPTVKLINDTATDVAGSDNQFVVTTLSGTVIHGRKILFATGIKDIMPAIEGFSACWGISVIHCPYCHGYEYRGQDTGIFLNGEMAVEFAALISNWTDKLTVFTNGKSTIPAGSIKAAIVEKEIARVHHTNGRMEYLVFTDGSTQPLNALYAKLPFVQHTTIPAALGCKMTEQGYIEVNEFKKTSVPGVFAAGDNTTPMRAVAGAVGAGTLVGAVIVRELLGM
ncbi:Thioredoxin reductase [Chitinophaga sp. YR573]|uniref:NAD(P)/FAD-dependent oxidoreductase n=1 Tax=Chitinophaga sp. YR573 TaxID=1881040 RepID=UPI0008D6D86D|nr:NAD(P)/FAD-dependent oxidoreductase [Chitinophaga sp. YR573]SEW36159.1 Thioredoxin reductase [Chitinophaga sp. YR573]